MFNKLTIVIIVILITNIISSAINIYGISTRYTVSYNKWVCTKQYRIEKILPQKYKCVQYTHKEAFNYDKGQAADQ